MSRDFPRRRPGRSVLAWVSFGAALLPLTGASAQPVSTGTFTAAGSMSIGRWAHTATSLDDGTVLVTGGFAPAGITETAEIYDPATGTFHATGSMSEGRALHSATLLNDGTVLVAGGASVDEHGITASADLYDPATGTFIPVGPMHSSRSLNSATLLADGTVLLAGGNTMMVWNTWAATTDSAELYDPGSRTFIELPSMHERRAAFGATRLTDGRVVIAGGYYTDPVFAIATAKTDIFDPTTRTFTELAPLLAPRQEPTSSLLPDGRVIFAGGANGGVVNTTDIFDPATMSFAAGPNLTTPRDGHTATTLPDGRILFTGGLNVYFSNTAEIYDPLTGLIVPVPLGIMSSVRALHAAALLSSGQVLVTGGCCAAQAPVVIKSAELFSEILPVELP